MNINDFIWPDSSLLELQLNNLNHSLSLKIKNYRNDLFLLIFEQIDELVIHDPIYFMEIKKEKKSQKYWIDFWDDEGSVLRFKYDKASITSLTE